MSAAFVMMSPDELRALVRDAVKEALDACAGLSPSGEWIAVTKCGLPAASVRKLVKKGVVRGCLMGRASHVHCADLKRHLESAASPKTDSAPVVDIRELNDPYARALRNGAERRAS